MKEDKIQIEIMEDGQVKIVTDEIGAANHRSADDLLKFLESQLGGEVKKQKRPQSYQKQKQKQTA